MNTELFTNPDFMTSVFYFFSFGLFSWFMGWGVSFITHLFIKIIEKGGV